MKDIAYYALGIFMILGVIGLVRGLINPAKFHKDKPAPSRKSLALTLVAFLLIGGSLLSVLEPVHLKESRNKATEQSAVSTQTQEEDTQHEIHLTEEEPVDEVETKTETKTEAVPFDSTSQNDSTMTSGTSKVSVAGVNGERTLTYKVTYTNGVETAREQTGSEVTKQPVTQVTKVGTKKATTTQTAPKATGGVVKKSSTGICHAPGTTYYNQTKNYTSFSSVDACLASGGRLPKR